jgi:hypothetical protein
MRKSLLPLVFALCLLSACGGDDEEPSADDRSTLQVVLTSHAAVQRAVGGFYSCLPDDAACYREAGPAIVEAVERALPVVDAAMEETDDQCLARAAGVYRDSLVAYSRLGRAAADGDTKTADEEDSATIRLDADFWDKLRRCGVTAGRPAQLAQRLSAVSAGIGELGTQMAMCRDEACARDLAEQMETSAIIGQSVLRAMVTGFAADAPACMRTAFSEYESVFAALEAMAEKIQRGRFAAAEREAARIVDLGPAAEEDKAACIGSAGS